MAKLASDGNECSVDDLELKQYGSEIAAFGHRGTSHNQTQDCTFAGFMRKVVDQRFLAAGKASRAALGIGIAVDQLGVFDQTSFQPTGPAQPRRQRFAGFNQQRAFLTDSGFDQPFSQGGTPQL